MSSIMDTVSVEMMVMLDMDEQMKENVMSLVMQIRPRCVEVAGVTVSTGQVCLHQNNILIPPP